MKGKTLSETLEAHIKRIGRDLHDERNNDSVLWCRPIHRDRDLTTLNANNIHNVFFLCI